MKRKISNIILILTLLLVPFSAYAGCSTPNVGGGASSGDGTPPGAGGCTSPHCLDIGIDGNRFEWVGVRLQIYEYDGSGNADNIKLVGHGVDLWATDKFHKGYYSSPDTPNLKFKAKCKDGVSAYSGGHQETHKYDRDEYLEKFKNQIRIDTGLSWYFQHEKLNSYLLVHNNGTPISGWFAENLLKKIIRGAKSDYNDLNTIFGLSETQVDNLRSNSNKYYITAEILYRFRERVSEVRYYGTVSEGAKVHGNARLYNALYIKEGTNPDVGKVVGKNYLIKKTAGGDILNAYLEGGDYRAKETACNVARGYAVWNIGVICWECGYTCETSCKYTSNGTPERAACAVSWCSKNKKDNVKSCVNSCTTVPKDEGCGKKENKCTEYQSGKVESSSGTGTCKTSSNGLDGQTAEVSATVCYDDNKSFGDKKDTNFNIGGITYSSTKYYKIVCEDKMTLTNLPSEKVLYLMDDKPGNIHFSYAIKYNKTCELLYKISDSCKGNSSKLKELGLKSNVTWFSPTTKAGRACTKYNEDINNLKSAINAAKKELDALKAAQEKDKTNEQIAKNITIQTNAIKYYNDMIDILAGNKSKNIIGIKETAEQRFATVMSEKTAEKLKVNEVKLKTYNYKKIQESEETTINLIPVICTPTEYNKKDKFVCLINGKETDGYQTITIGGKSYTCRGAGDKTDQSGNKRTYEEVIVYSVPDSYISAHTNSSGSVFHNEKECEDNVKAANGFCKVVEYGYTFPGFDGQNLDKYIEEVNKIPNKLTMSVTGGICDELSYDYNCDYKVEKKYCKECEGYTKGTQAYNDCFEKYCGCDSYCGSDMACRFMYCPTTCDSGCNWKTVTVKCTECSDTCDKISNKNSVEYQTCFYDECCTKKCDGNCPCIYDCCVDKCNTLYEGNTTKLESCKKSCQKDTCGGSNYIYRNISLNNPFPERGTSTGIIGNNWYDKEKYITNTDEDTYRDETDGKSSNFEYSVEINSKQLKEVKKVIAKNKTDESGYKDSTIYKSFGSSNTFTSAIDSDAYCSKFLHEDLVSIIGESKYHETQDATMNCRTR